MLRIGQGFDAHAFAADRALVLGGVRIDYHLGMAAHSDGDVVLHALCDALLGASGLGDIGAHFPDTDPAYKNADSRVLLRSVVSRVHEQGLRVVNADSTIVAQAPKLKSYLPSMRENMAADLQIAPELVNVKATTTERMGFTGREEGIAAMAVVLLSTPALDPA